MSRFLECLDVVLENEGGLSDHKADRGGRTNYGVTQKTYDAYRRASGHRTQPVDKISTDEVKQIYFSYWEDCKADMMPEPLDLFLFDCAINSGASRAVKLLQECIETTTDGRFGPATREALHNFVMDTSVEYIAKQYLDARRSWYDQIIERDPSQSVFARGWMKRIDDLEEYLA